jgi:hypothetical protein
MSTLSRNHGMLSIARRSETVHRFSCDTKTRSWRNCGDERRAVDGEQQTWTRLGDHSRLDRMSLLTNNAGKRVALGEVLRQQHKEHDANQPHILSHISNCDLLQESYTNNDQCTQTLW